MDYLAIINRTDFTNLYKFGHLFIHNMVPFDGDIQKHSDDKQLFNAVTTRMDTYEYASEYLLLHISRDGFCGSTEDIYVSDIVSLYALNQEAKDNLSLSLDPRIKIQVTCWANMFYELNKRQAECQAIAGMHNCFEIFQITEDERKFVKSILPKNFIEELFNDLFNRKRPSGDKNLWNYIIRYERHSPYWNDKRGYFLDAIHAFENFKQRKEVEFEIADETPEGDIIARCGDSFNEILHNLTCIDSIYNVEKCDFFVVAPLYFYLKGYFGDSGITPSRYLNQESLFSSLHRSFGGNFALAIALLGISLGQDLTYSCYYEIKNIGIFQTADRSNLQSKDSTLTLINPVSNLPMEHAEAQSLIEELYNEVISLRGKDENHFCEEVKDEDLEAKSKSEKNQPNNSANVEDQETQSPNFQPTSNEDDSLYYEIKESESPYLKTTVSTSGLDSVNNSGTGNNDGATPEESYFEPVVMRKLNRNRTGFDKRSKNPKYAHTQEEYDKLYNKGYAPENFFDSNSLLNQMID